MVRRRNNRRNGGEKRPTATLDLKAKEVAEKEALKQDKQPPADKSAETATQDGQDEVSDQMNMKPENNQESQPRSGSLWQLVLAALLGGIIAVLAQDYYLKYFSVPTTQDVTPLTSKIADLEQRISELDKAKSSNEVANRIAALEAEVLTAKNNENGLGGRIESVEKTINDLALASKGGDAELASIAAIATRVNGIETRLNNEVAALKGPFKQNLKSEIEFAAKDAASLEVANKIDMVRSKIDRLGDRLQDVEAKYFASDGKVRDKINEVETAVKLMQSDGMTQQRFDKILSPFKSELSALSTKLAEISKREAEAHESARRSALALAFANLKRVLDRGEPFNGELRSVKSLAGNDVDFRQLDTLSSEGVPTETALIRAFPELAVAALEKGRAGDDGSSWDKLLNKARTTLRYRKTGDVKGDNSEAILARMEHKFRSGDTESALEEFKLLPPVEASVVGPWTEKLKVRLMIESEMHRLEDQLLQSLRPRT